MTQVTMVELWGEHDLFQKPSSWSIGPLRLWCKKVADEVWVAFEYRDGDGGSARTADLPEAELNWSRWVLKGLDEGIRLFPVFQDRPIVVKPEFPFRLSYGAKARIYVRVPLWVRIEEGAKRKHVITEIPTVVLSKTWFGSFTEGEVCYWISTGARRQIEPDPLRPYMAICPIQIVNTAETDLHVEKLALRVGLFSLFDSQGQLWSNEMRINYRGKNEVSEINVKTEAPVEVKGAKLVGAARSTFRKSLAARTFSTIKDLPGLDLLIK